MRGPGHLLAAALTLMMTLVAAAAAHAKSHRDFTLTSSDVHPGVRIDARHVANTFGCTGQNISPALAWQGAPAGTKSFAITVYDPDAPTGSGWWHWVVYNLPATTTSLPTGAGAAPPAAHLPEGAVQGNTDFGTPGYGGPCPPAGDKPHRYIFTVYALKVPKIDVPPTATAAFVGFALHANMLGSATFTAPYGR